VGPLRTAIALVLWFAAAAAAGGEAGLDSAAPALGRAAARGAEVLNRYHVAQQRQQASLRDTSMDVTIEASLPRLKKAGKLQAQRQIASSGEITYEDSRTEGDKTVIKDVIARYLSAETEASRGLVDMQGNPQSIAITSDNYRFRLKATLNDGAGDVYIFDLTPRKKRLGLFKGELWVDGATGMPVREAGRLVRNPSVFLSRVEFVIEYEIRDGLAVPIRAESSIDTRLVGRAELEIHYSNPSGFPGTQARICALGW